MNTPSPPPNNPDPDRGSSENVPRDTGRVRSGRRRAKRRTPSHGQTVQAVREEMEQREAALREELEQKEAVLHQVQRELEAKEETLRETEQRQEAALHEQRELMARKERAFAETIEQREDEFRQQLEQSGGDLTGELAARDEIISALTAQLEQAAEQLDRLRRSGADRATPVSESGATGMVAAARREEAEEQKALVQELQLAVSRWTDFDASSVLGRIEIQIGELRDLVAKSATPGNEAPARPQEDRSSWERMKAQMLGDELPSDPSPISATTPTDQNTNSEPDTTSTSQADGVGLREVFVDVDGLEVPSDIDFENADRVELELAIEERNRCIGELLRHLRTIGSSRYRAPDWTLFAEAPEELREQLDQLAGRFRELLRVAEVELSMERARLGREKNRIAQFEKMLGRAAENTVEDDDGQTGSKWRRLLGISSDEE